MALTHDDVWIFVWDWEAQFPFSQFREAQAKGYLYLAFVDDTGGDQYVAYASPEPLTDDEAQRLFDTDPSR